MPDILDDDLKPLDDILKEFKLPDIEELKIPDEDWGDFDKDWKIT